MHVASLGKFQPGGYSRTSALEATCCRYHPTRVFMFELLCEYASAEPLPAAVGRLVCIQRTFWVHLSYHKCAVSLAPNQLRPLFSLVERCGAGGGHDLTRLHLQRCTCRRYTHNRSVRLKISRALCGFCRDCSPEANRSGFHLLFAGVPRQRRVEERRPTEKMKKEKKE